MNKFFLLVVLFFSCSICFSKDKKAQKIEKKKMDKEERKFQKNLEKYSDSAQIFWEHANKICNFKSQIRDAKYFYEKALELDSANGAIRKDYGKYLYEKLFMLDESRKELSTAMLLLPKDDEVKKYILTVDKAIEKREFEAKLRDFGHFTQQYCDTNINYKCITNTDSLKKLTIEPGNKYNYENLLKRYLGDDSTITPQEMFMLIVGFSGSKFYNPFNYLEINALKSIAQINQDTGIRKGMNMIVNNPLNPSINREIMYCYRKKGNLEMAQKFENRIHKFFDGMLWSGNGTCDRPYISLWSKEEYNFINYIGCTSAETHSMETCAGQMAEMIDMKRPNSQEIEKIYFNVKMIYLQTVGK